MALPKLRPDDQMSALRAFLRGTSVEVMPRTSAKIASFRGLLPAGNQVFIAHINGTSLSGMQATVVRLSVEGFAPVPHIPARLIPDGALEAWVAAYRAAGARHALLLGGGLDRPTGTLHEAMQLLESGLFDDFDGVFVAGHPEGSRDIDPGGGEAGAIEALHRKQEWSRRTGVPMTIVTQFLFEPAPVIDWTRRLADAGIDLPIRIGVAGPGKLQTLIRYAISCGVGPSLRVLQRRARDLKRLMLPVTPDDMLLALAQHKAANPDWRVEGAHIFPLGGITAATDWLADHR